MYDENQRLLGSIPSILISFDGEGRITKWNRAAEDIFGISPSVAVDIAWAYIFVRDPSINQNEGSTATNGLINGSYRNNVNIVGAQLTYTFK